MRDFHFAISALTNRLKLMVGRGRVQTGKDDGPVQILQVVLSPKETPNMPRVGEFGLASWPMKDCDAVVVFVTGDRSNGVILGTNDQNNRFKLENPGESALFDAFGKSIWLKKDAGGMVIEAGGQPITINNAKGLTINSSDDVTINMGGKNLTIANAGAVILGPGGKKVVVDGDPVSAGVVHATQTIVKA